MSEQECYTDRNLAVQVLARLAQELGLDVGLRIDPEEHDWPVLYVRLAHRHGYSSIPQISWHLSKDDLIGEWPEYADEWDGHTTEEKRQRMIEYLNEWRARP